MVREKCVRLLVVVDEKIPAIIQLNSKALPLLRFLIDK
jgi:hypothetical protein